MKKTIPARADALMEASAALAITFPHDVDFLAVVENIDTGSRAKLGFSTLTAAVRKAAARLERRVYDDNGSLRIGPPAYNSHVLAYRLVESEKAYAAAVSAYSK